MKSFKQILLESKLFEGYTEEQWRKLDSRTKTQYIKDHPNSKYAKKLNPSDKNNINYSSIEDGRYGSKKDISNISVKNNKEARFGAALNNKLDQDSADIIAAKMSTKDKFDVLEFDKDISTNMLKSLAKDRNPQIKKNALYILMNRNDKSSKYNAAENPKTSPEILSKLAKHRDPDIRLSVAKNPNTSQDDLYDLAIGNDIDITDEVYANPNLSAKTKRAIDKYWDNKIDKYWSNK